MLLWLLSPWSVQRLQGEDSDMGSPGPRKVRTAGVFPRPSFVKNGVKRDTEDGVEVKLGQPRPPVSAPLS